MVVVSCPVCHKENNAIGNGTNCRASTLVSCPDCKRTLIQVSQDEAGIANKMPYIETMVPEPISKAIVLFYVKVEWCREDLLK
jgi:uncharacterized protein YbaR (Trm112 family)